jgi:hypothetical protein
MSSGNNDFAILCWFYYPGLVVVVVVVLVLVLVLVEVVVVVGTYSQHSVIEISCHLPTVGFFLLKIKEPATTLPLPS